ncbi:MAG: hypothetical protein NVS2B15_01050 [Pseudarthrobacter sp.]
MRTLADDLEAPDDIHTRIVVAAYALFSRRGIRDVGVDELIRRDGPDVAAEALHELIVDVRRGQGNVLPAFPVQG